ncbi:MAG: hypothetical protein K9J82_00530 [Methylotenera sp.]|jgi:hypothetical protein|nr:hypothetical protein [Methylotenera sp.]
MSSTWLTRLAGMLIATVVACALWMATVVTPESHGSLMVAQAAPASPAASSPGSR